MAANFSILLVIATLLTGLIALLDKLFWAKKRQEKIEVARQSIVAEVSDEVLANVAPEPSWIETSKSIFPVIAIVLVLRSFLYEPFQIPSGSMMPTLLVGDFVLVEKFSYGLKDPAFRFKFLPTGSPQRGDIIVFKYPLNTQIDYIKRVVGLPGDTIVYRNKQLYIKEKCDGDNCPDFKPILTEYVRRGEFKNGVVELEEYIELLGDVSHSILKDPSRIDDVQRYKSTSMRDSWLVPEGHYFAMGDSRDNSEDGRYWGFVSDDNLVGKAVAIWMSFEFEREADSFLPRWIPTGVRFNRIGGLD